MGLRLCLDAADSLARTIAPAPSEIPEALPVFVCVCVGGGGEGGHVHNDGNAYVLNIMASTKVNQNWQRTEIVNEMRESVTSAPAVTQPSFWNKAGSLATPAIDRRVGCC